MRTRRLVIPLLTFGLVLAAAVGPAAQTAKGKTSTQRSESWKTPWGDPDLQGTWSSDDLRGIPVQRADEFAGRAELSDEEFSKRQAANQEARTRELNRVGAFRNDVGTRTFRQTSLIVEPADGRIPPLTREGERRTTVIAAARRTAPNS